MSMSILNAQEPQEKKAVLPPISASRLRLLILMGSVVFAACVAIALQIAPGPHREVDYLVIGTIGVGLALVAVFIGLKVNRRKLFITPDDESTS